MLYNSSSVQCFVKLFIVGIDDLLSLEDFNEGSLLYTIRLRYKNANIYTSIGTPILISVNPF